MSLHHLLRDKLDFKLNLQAFLIGKDVGARVAYLFPLFHPERVCGVITLGIPYLPPNAPVAFPHLPEGFYIERWQVDFVIIGY